MGWVGRLAAGSHANAQFVPLFAHWGQGAQGKCRKFPVEFSTVAGILLSFRGSSFSRQARELNS
jgi:hypothetical protein